MIIETIVTGPLQQNCFLVADPDASKGFIIDPGWDVPDILKIILKHNIKDITILCTHGHFDHISGVPELRDSTGAKAYMNSADNFFIPSVNGQTALMCGMGNVKDFTFDGDISDGDEFIAGIVSLKAIATPGHSPGGISFHDGGSFVFAGDCLFLGSVGRVDLPKSSGKDLLHSINKKLYTLPDEMIVYCGHGPHTMIGHEKASNPFTNNPAYLLG